MVMMGNTPVHLFIMHLPLFVIVKVYLLEEEEEEKRLE